jgi:hypothetical protein
MTQIVIIFVAGIHLSPVKHFSPPDTAEPSPIIWPQYIIFGAEMDVPGVTLGVTFATVTVISKAVTHVTLSEGQFNGGRFLRCGVG